MFKEFGVPLFWDLESTSVISGPSKEVLSTSSRNDLLLAMPACGLIDNTPAQLLVCIRKQGGLSVLTTGRVWSSGVGGAGPSMLGSASTGSGAQDSGLQGAFCNANRWLPSGTCTE